MKIFLVLFHGGNQCFGGDFKKGLVKFACQGHRPFVKCGDFIKQIIINHGCAACLRSNLGNTLANQGAARCKISHYIGFLQFAGIVRRGADQHIAIAVKAMAARRIACGQAHHGRVDNGIA